MITEDKFYEYLDNLLKTSEELLTKHKQKEIIALFHIVVGKKILFVPVGQIKNKTLWEYECRKAVTENHAEAAFLTSEAWMAEISTKDEVGVQRFKDGKVRPSEHEGKKEIVLICGKTEAGLFGVMLEEIVRTETGKIIGFQNKKTIRHDDPKASDFHIRFFDKLWPVTNMQ